MEKYVKKSLFKEEVLEGLETWDFVILDLLELKTKFQIKTTR